MRRQARASMSRWVQVWPVTHSGDCPAVILEGRAGEGLQGTRTPCPDTGLCLRLKTSNTSSLHFTLENRWRTEGACCGEQTREKMNGLYKPSRAAPPAPQRTRPSRTLTPAPRLSSLPASGHRHSPVHPSSGLTGTWQHGHHLKSRLGPCFLSVVATAIWDWSFMVQEFPDTLSPDAQWGTLSHDNRKEGSGARCWPSLRTTEPHAREGTTARLHCTLASVPGPLVNW